MYLFNLVEKNKGKNSCSEVCVNAFPLIIQVLQMHAFGQLLVFVVPLVLSVMNCMWFAIIFKGLKKTLAKRQ